MAAIQRYVNTASAGGDGTTNNTSGASAAYASLASWEANEQADLVSAGDTHTVDCCGTAADTTGVVVDGWTTGVNNGITIRGNRSDATGFNDGIAAFSSNHYRIVVTSGIPLQISESDVTVDGIQLHVNHTTSFTYALYFLSPRSLAKNNRIIGNKSSESTGIYFAQVTGDCAAQNNIIQNCNRGIHAQVVNFGTSTIDITGNTIFDGVTGIRLLDGASSVSTYRIHNNAVANQSTADFEDATLSASPTITSTHNASDDLFGTSAQDLSPGATESAEWPNHFTDVASAQAARDFSPVSSGALVDTGTSGSGILTTDIIGTARGAAYDIGAWEFASGLPTAARGSLLHVQNEGLFAGSGRF